MTEVYAESGAVDLSEQTNKIVSALTDVEETSEGVFTGTLDPESEIMQDLVGTAAGTGADSGTVAEPTEATVALDEDGLLKKMEIVLPETDGIAVTLVSEVTETGVDYDITAPESTNLHSYEEYRAGIGAV